MAEMENLKRKTQTDLEKPINLPEVCQEMLSSWIAWSWLQAAMAIAKK